MTLKATKGWVRKLGSGTEDQERIFYVEAPEVEFPVRIIMDIFKMDPKERPDTQRYRLHVRLGTEELFRNHVPSMEQAKKECEDGLRTICQGILEKLK